MCKKGYKQTEEHKRKVVKTLTKNGVYKRQRNRVFPILSKESIKKRIETRKKNGW